MNIVALIDLIIQIYSLFILVAISVAYFKHLPAGRKDGWAIKQAVNVTFVYRSGLGVKLFGLAAILAIFIFFSVWGGLFLALAYGAGFLTNQKYGELLKSLDPKHAAAQPAASPSSDV